MKKIINNVFKKIVTFFASLGVVGVIAYLFDYPLYFFVIRSLGLTYGFITMFFASLVLNFILIIFYDKTKKDIFGFEKLKELKGKVTEKKGFFSVIVKAGSAVTFVSLSVYDPFLATLWFRKATDFEGFTKSDGKLLVLSTLLGNTIWAPTTFAILKAVF